MSVFWTYVAVLVSILIMYGVLLTLAKMWATIKEIRDELKKLNDKEKV